jgi:DNA-binding GntR family transcriptional regulator
MTNRKTAAVKSHTRQPLSAAAYEKIYRRIMVLEYEPGRRLEEKQLILELGIGRTPIREALVHLADDFMVEAHPKAGVIVRPITLQNTKATFAALRIMEAGVAELAMSQDLSELLSEMKEANRGVREAMVRMDLTELVEANSEFHHLYARCSRNEYLINALHKVRCETNRLAWLSYGNEIDPKRSLQVHYQSVVREHDRIIEGLAQRDEVRLKKTVLKHIATFQQRIVRYVAT